jgi:hypothetical protein
VNDDIFCKVFLNSSDAWISALLTYVNLEKNVAEIFLPIKYLTRILNDNQTIIIKSFNAENEYIFTGSVSKKVISINKQSITVSIEEVIKYDNARQDERFTASYPVILSNKALNLSQSALLVDISSGGLLIATTEEIEINANITVEIFFSPEASLSFHGRILRKTKNNIGYSYGIIIEEIDRRNSILLNKMIEFLALEKNSLYSEWLILKRLRQSLYFIFVLFFVITILFIILYF